MVLSGCSVLNVKPLTATPVNEQFVKPAWARIECAPSDSYEGIQQVHIPKGGVSVYCGLTDNTDSCNYYLNAINPVLWSNAVLVKYKQCDNDGTNCDLKENSVQINAGSNRAVIKLNVPSGKKLFTRCERTTLGIDVECDVIKEYRPWQLYRFVGGAKFEAKSTDCCLTSSLNPKLVTSDNMPNCLTKTGGSGSKWVNYVDEWYYGPQTNVFKHPQYGQVYCTAGRLYTIVKLTMRDGTIKRLDPTYEGRKDDGTTLKGLGNFLGQVDCCPNEPSCTASFTWGASGEGKSCYSDNQCFNVGDPVPITSTTFKKQNCQNGKCVWSEAIKTECTTNSACPTGQICDFTAKNYGKCVTQTNPSTCGDKICGREETNANCPEDCKSTPKPVCESCFGWALNLFTKNGYCEAKTNTVSILGLFKVQVPSQAAFCPIFLIIIGGLLLIFLIIIIAIIKKSGKKVNKRRRR